MTKAYQKKSFLEPEAILKEASLKEPKDEYKMRVRVSLRALWALYDMRHLLTFFTFFIRHTFSGSHLRTFFPILLAIMVAQGSAIHVLCVSVRSISNQFDPMV